MQSIISPASHNPQLGRFNTGVSTRHEYTYVSIITANSGISPRQSSNPCRLPHGVDHWTHLSISSPQSKHKSRGDRSMLLRIVVEFLPRACGDVFACRSSNVTELSTLAKMQQPLGSRKMKRNE